MDNQQVDNRIPNPDDAWAEAYVEDFGRSMQQGKEPALMQQSKVDVEASQVDYQTAMSSMEQFQALNEINGPSVMETNIEGYGPQEAAASLQDAPVDGQTAGDKSNTKQKKKQNLFTRALTRVTAPVKKAEAFIQGQKEAYIQRQIDYSESVVKQHQQDLQRQQARMQEVIAQQVARDAKRNAFKQSITHSGKNLKETIQNKFTKTGDFVKGAVQKGRGVPRFASNVVKDIQDGWSESKSFVNDTLNRGRDGVQSVKERSMDRRTGEVTSNEVISQMAERMQEKHVERTQFNSVMLDAHGKDVGYRSLDISEDSGSDEANQMAHLETKDFINPGEDGQLRVQHNASYYQYMLNMKSEQAMAESNGQMDGQDFKDKAKELYEMLLEEKGESESTKDLNVRLKDSYKDAFPSKRLSLYLAKNPSLTSVDEGLTNPTMEQDADVSWQYDTASANFEDRVAASTYDISADVEPVVAHREQSINKEFNGVAIEDEGYIDLNQEDSKVVQLETARMQREGSLAAVASGKPTSPVAGNEDMIKGLMRTQLSYNQKAIADHKAAEQMSLNLGSLDGDGPVGP